MNDNLFKINFIFNYMVDRSYTFDSNSMESLEILLKAKGYFILEGDIVSQHGRGDLLGRVLKKEEGVEISVVDVGSPLEREVVAYHRMDSSLKDLTDPKSRLCLYLWQQEAYNLKREERDDIVKAYLKHIVGVPDEILIRFTARTPDAWKLIGKLDADVLPFKLDNASFWKEVQGILPSLCPDYDWLVQNSFREGSFNLLCQLDSVDPSDAMEGLQDGSYKFNPVDLSFEKVRGPIGKY